MRLCDGIHQIKINFQVTPQVQRYVYVYLLVGEKCWLIDSGVSGAEQVIEDALKDIGRTTRDIKGILLTHAHPDHIGGAARIKEAANCFVASSQGERPWIEDIHLQHQERPIPNFFTLVQNPVPVDKVLNDGDRLSLEEGMTLRVIGSPGHSQDGLSYLWEEKGVLFTGDAIPITGDIPIWINTPQSEETLHRFQALEDICLYCPAWDQTYDAALGQQKLAAALTLIRTLRDTAAAIPTDNPETLARELCTTLGMPHFLNNPLFLRTVAALR